ncbi:MAG: hypothetical protein JSW40_00505 [Candidatus Omnitrophota bacterium]|nr:MAG: hypothetical protein JSW40_00505 [Candidatus Omnitrophota bacterium]
MKRGLVTLLGIGFLLATVTVYAQEQIVVLDPISTYEIEAGEEFFLPVGANFLLPGDPEHHKLFVNGAPIHLEITESSYYRIAGVIADRLPEGDYYLTIVALDERTGARTQGTMKLRVVGRLSNAPIIFESLEQVKKLQTRKWYSFAIAATDEDPERLILEVIGDVGNALGYARFRQTADFEGRAGGVLNMYLWRPGELKISVNARDTRPADMGHNRAVAELHFIVE